MPLPAVAQEYVDHGGCLWKVYVAGRQVYWTLRRSTPDLAGLAAQLEADPEGADIPASIAFDSLKSLPTSLPWLRGGAGGSGSAGGGAAAAAAEGAAAAAGAGEGAERGPPPGQELMRQSTFEAVADALREGLGLTLFGFDLVFDSAAGGWGWALG